jgi:hypothetical protein
MMKKGIITRRKTGLEERLGEKGVDMTDFRAVLTKAYAGIKKTEAKYGRKPVSFREMIDNGTPSWHKLSKSEEQGCIKWIFIALNCRIISRNKGYYDFTNLGKDFIGMGNGHDKETFSEKERKRFRDSSYKHVSSARKYFRKGKYSGFY